MQVVLPRGWAQRYKATASWTLEKLAGVTAELYPKLFDNNGNEAECYKQQTSLVKTNMKSTYLELKVLEDCSKECVAGRTKELEFGMDEVNKAITGAKVLCKGLAP